MINCLIVDDEHLALQLLETYIEKLPNLVLLDKCENALEALDVLNTQSVDLLFLDIQMPNLTGLDFLKSLPNHPTVILTTAYGEYALESYELNVTDYLVKPFSFERFLLAVNKATSKIQLEKESKSTVPNDYFFVKADNKWVKIKYKDILYVEGLREYVSIYTTQKRIVTHQSMKNMEKMLLPYQCMRVHKSYIISIDKMDAMNGNAVEIGENKIPVGKSYRSELLKWVQKQ